MKIPTELEGKVDNILNWCKGKCCILAFSGGVDSALLGRILVEAYDLSLLEIPPMGFYANSPTSTSNDVLEVKRVADEIRLPLIVLESGEFNEPLFVENSSERCYWCKRWRFGEIKRKALQMCEPQYRSQIVLVDGSNSDDSFDYRPGTKAAKEIGVYSPLAEFGFSKKEIRALASSLELSVANKPSTPCLATRLAYNLTLSEDRLRRVESAEQIIQEYTGGKGRARMDAPDSIRIELPEEYIESFATPEIRSCIVSKLRELGFNFISLDLEGFLSGKYNRMLK